jgi:hypothetical protein
MCDISTFGLTLRAAGLAGALLGVTVGPPGPDGGDLPAQLLVAGACAQRALQVVPGEPDDGRPTAAAGSPP